MRLPNSKNINIEVPHEVWKKLKMLSISKDSTLQEIVKDILENSVNKKKIDVPDIE